MLKECFLSSFLIVIRDCLCPSRASINLLKKRILRKKFDTFILSHEQINKICLNLKLVFDCNEIVTYSSRDYDLYFLSHQHYSISSILHITLKITHVETYSFMILRTHEVINSIDP